MSQVVESEFDIINALGLHARAAAQLVKVANKFTSDVTLESDGQQANGKSIMGVLMLAAGKGSKVKVICTGDDAAACVKEIGELIANRFGEAQ